MPLRSRSSLRTGGSGGNSGVDVGVDGCGGGGGDSGCKDGGGGGAEGVDGRGAWESKPFNRWVVLEEETLREARQTERLAFLELEAIKVRKCDACLWVLCMFFGQFFTFWVRRMIGMWRWVGGVVRLWVGVGMEG